VSLNVNHEEHVIRALADTGASSSIILEAYTSKDLIKQDKDNKTTWVTMGGQFTTEKTGLVNFCCQIMPLAFCFIAQTEVSIFASQGISNLLL
jgi:hypothetical protein